MDGWVRPLTLGPDCSLYPRPKEASPHSLPPWEGLGGLPPEVPPPSDLSQGRSPAKVPVEGEPGPPALSRTRPLGAECMEAPSRPACACLFLFPGRAVEARLFSANEPADPPIKCGSGALFFSHPSCF